MRPYTKNSLGTYASEYDVLDNDENVIGSIKPKRPKYTGAYWYMYSSLSGDEGSNYAQRDNSALLVSLCSSAQRLYFVILKLLTEQYPYSSQITFNLQIVNSLLSNHQDTETKCISRGTFYTGINDLIRIEFMKRVKKDTYKINSNYLFTKKDPNPERW